MNIEKDYFKGTNTGDTNSYQKSIIAGFSKIEEEEQKMSYTQKECNQIWNIIIWQKISSVL